MLRDGFHQHAVHGGRGAVQAELARRRLPVPRRRRRDGAFVDVPARVAEAVKVRGQPGVVRRPLQPGAAVLAEHDRRSRRSTSSAAYTFELGKCYEQAIKERQLLALANIDAELCAAGRRRARAAGAGADRAAGRPRRRARRCPRSGGTWPTDGRIVGIVVDPDGDLDRRRRACAAAVSAAGMVPLVIAPHGGKLSDGTDGRSAPSRPPGPSSSTRCCSPGSPAPAPDALRRPGQQGRRGRLRRRLDPRVLLLLEECFRHAKAIGAWGAGVAALEPRGCRRTRPAS